MNFLEINLETLLAYPRGDQWDLGNKVLYDLCRDHFTHKTEQEIIAKIWLIGRAYAAAIERRKNKGDINDNFYIEKVAPAFLNSNLDEQFEQLKNTIANSKDSFVQGLYLHGYLIKLIKGITGLDKRSLSSKYLHFHFPEVFFIYDSRAVFSMSSLVKKVPANFEPSYLPEHMDKAYFAFARKCLFLKDQIFEKYGLLLNPRQLDNLLMDHANRRLTSELYTVNTI